MSTQSVEFITMEKMSLERAKNGVEIKVLMSVCVGKNPKPYFPSSIL